MNVVVPADPSVAVRPITRAMYGDLIDQGHFADENVELLEGVLVAMPSMKDPHAWATKLLARWMIKGLPAHLLVGPQTPIAASDWSEPQPDISVTDYQPDVPGHPVTAHLVIEVTHTTHRTDLVIKPPIYAAAGVPQYWVIDLAARRAVIHTDPVEGRYTTVRDEGAEAVLRYEGVDVPLAELWPRPSPFNAG